MYVRANDRARHVTTWHDPVLARIITTDLDAFKNEVAAARGGIPITSRLACRLHGDHCRTTPPLHNHWPAFDRLRIPTHEEIDTSGYVDRLGQPCYKLLHHQATTTKSTHQSIDISAMNRE